MKLLFTFGFYNSLNGDRKYNAEQMSSIFDGIITDGVYNNVGELFAVVPGTGLQVIVKTGRAWFKHTWNLNDSWLPLDIDTADIYRPRIDSVVLEINSNTDVRENSIKIIKGNPAMSPLSPVLVHENGVDQYLLANVRVEANSTSIPESKIEMKVGQGDTPFVTAPLESVPIDDLFVRWNGEFEEWFNNLQAQLTDNVVTNLLNEINKRVKISDKATIDDINNKVPDKWLDAETFTTMNASLFGLPVGSVIRCVCQDLEKEYPGKFITCDQRAIDDPEISKVFTDNKGFRPQLPHIIPNNPLSGFGNGSTCYASRIIGNIEYNGKAYFMSSTAGTDGGSSLVKFIAHDPKTDSISTKTYTMPNTSLEMTKYFIYQNYAICIPSGKPTFISRINLESPYDVLNFNISIPSAISHAVVKTDIGDRYIYIIGAQVAYSDGISKLLNLFGIRITKDLLTVDSTVTNFISNINSITARERGIYGIGGNLTPFNLYGLSDYNGYFCENGNNVYLFTSSISLAGSPFNGLASTAEFPINIIKLTINDEIACTVTRITYTLKTLLETSDMVPKFYPSPFQIYNNTAYTICAFSYNYGHPLVKININLDDNSISYQTFDKKFSDGSFLSSGFSNYVRSISPFINNEGKLKFLVATFDRLKTVNPSTGVSQIVSALGPAMIDFDKNTYEVISDATVPTDPVIEFKCSCFDNRFPVVAFNRGDATDFPTDFKYPFDIRGFYPTYKNELVKRSPDISYTLTPPKSPAAIGILVNEHMRHVFYDAEDATIAANEDTWCAKTSKGIYYGRVTANFFPNESKYFVLPYYPDSYIKIAD